jgi:Mg-chelatase subunit ChlD
VVATIFDASGNALTASQTVVDDFIPRSEANVVFTWPEPIAKTVRSCEVPTDVVIAIDLSGSMNNDQADPPQPITAVKNAAQQFTARLQQRDQAALITFATDAVIAEPLARPAAVGSRITTLSIDPEEEQGSTNTGDAFVRAAELFASAAKNPDARRVMVVLTDGLATAPDEEPEEYAIARAEALRNAGVEVYAIGLGQEVNMEFVRAVASPGAAYQALNRDQVDRIYQDITGAICEDGAAVIDIVPKTNANFPTLRP